MMTGGAARKRQRVIPTAASATTRLSSSSITVIGSSFPDKTLMDVEQKPSPLRRSFSHPQPLTSLASAFTSADDDCDLLFNDSSTADVALRIFAEQTPFGSSEDAVPDESNIQMNQIYLHSRVLRRAKYFAALFSDRWKRGVDSGSGGYLRLKLVATPATGSIDTHTTVLQLLYTDDFSGVIDSASAALDILPVALELLFEDCVKHCVRYLECVPWTEEEEKRVLNLIPFLEEEESKELLARVYPSRTDSCEEMLQGLISQAINNHPNVAFVKAFVAKLLRDFSSRGSAKRVLGRAFETSLKIVKESLEEYSSPDFRGDHNETEAIQRLNLHTAMTNGRHLLWLVERMIELKVADSAVKEWSEHASFTSDLQRTFRDDAWRNIVPGLPAIVMRCTCRLANAVASGTILASREVRVKLVKEWLPVLIVCRENVSPMFPGQKQLYLELEETFLRIISTVPMSDAQELLQQCLSFSTRNVEDCPHLITAFNTWFRRASRPSST